MTDVLSSLVQWLHDVFVAQWDGWIVLGFVAQACFTMRFVVQWLASEKAKRSVMPVAFWFFSLFGGALLLIYAIQRKDPSLSPVRIRPDCLYPQSLAHRQREEANCNSRLTLSHGSKSKRRSDNVRSAF